MNLSQQVVSLDLAKRLKELGVKQESLFWWVRGEMEYGYEGEWHINETEEDKYFLFDEVVGKKFDDYDFHPITIDIGEDYEKWERQDKAGKKRMRKTTFSAFTVAELGEMLPEGIFCIRPLLKNTWGYEADGKFQVSYNDSGEYICMNDNFIDTQMSHTECADTEADARAKMLIYLIENKLITL